MLRFHTVAHNRYMVQRNVPFIQTTMQNLSITETKGLIPCYSYQIVPKYLVFTQQDWLGKAKVNFTQMKA